MNEHEIAQFYKSQWDFRWKNYKKRIADINTTFAQRFHLFKRSVKMHDDFQKIESTLIKTVKFSRDAERKLTTAIYQSI